MAKFFQRISQVFHDLKHESIFAILNRSVLRGKSLLVGMALQEAIARIISWRQPLPKTHKRGKRNLSRLKRSPQWYGISAVLVFLLIVLSRFPQNLVSMANAATTIQLPLFTKGSQIIDATGETVLLRGVNWFGMETDLHVPHGLWTRDYKEMLAQIKSL